MPSGMASCSEPGAGGCERLQKNVLNSQGQKTYLIIRADNLALIRMAQAIGMKKVNAFITRRFNGDKPRFLFSVSH